MSKLFRGTPKQQYKQRFLLMMLSYSLILPGIGHAFQSLHPRGAAAVLLALLPALPIIGLFVVIGKYLAQETDEYVRMLEVRKALVATGLTLSAATGWGFMEAFDVAPHIEAYWFVVLWFGGLGLGSCWNKVTGA